MEVLKVGVRMWMMDYNVCGLSGLGVVRNNPIGHALKRDSSDVLFLSSVKKLTLILRFSRQIMNGMLTGGRFVRFAGNTGEKAKEIRSFG